MILKNFEIKKKINNRINFYLLYGSNMGMIEDTIKNDLKPIFSKNVYKYDEMEIISNSDTFKETVLNGSFFENDKLIIISKVSDNILSIIEKLLEKKVNNIKFILTSGLLEKKSKLRNFFEKSNETIIVPFYDDNHQTFHMLIQKFFNERRIKISNEIINLVIKRTQGNRIALNNELNKIENYSLTNKLLDHNKIQKLIKLSDDYDLSELINQCLAGNKKKTIEILNENNFNNDNGIIFLKTFLAKLKRLKLLKKKLDKDSDINNILSMHKPSIFWKEKEIIKQQLKKKSLIEINSLLKTVNSLELMIKKNSQLSGQIINNFIFENLKFANSRI